MDKWKLKRVGIIIIHHCNGFVLIIIIEYKAKHVLYYYYYHPNYEQKRLMVKSISVCVIIMISTMALC